jgi:hypothetical protein
VFAKFTGSGGNNWEGLLGRFGLFDLNGELPLVLPLRDGGPSGDILSIFEFLLSFDFYLSDL